jgi:WS/DGAT/MGAT family acyltransferase
MEQLSGQDAMFLHAERDNLPQHFSGVGIYDQSTAPGGKVRFKNILALLQSRLHLSPIFQRKLLTVPLGVDRPYWMDDPNFDLEYHVRHIALPAPGDWRQFCILAARLHAQPLSRSKPLWEMYVIEGLNHIEGLPSNCFALMAKIHHAMMDGATGAKFFSQMHDLSPQPAEVPPPPLRTVARRSSDIELLSRAYFNALQKPAEAMDFFRYAVPAAQRIITDKLDHAFKELEDKPRTRFQGELSRYRVVEARKFDFETIRAIKHTAAGATINDVMLTIVGGALQEYLASKQELPSKSLVAGCPMDVRTDNEKAAGGNILGFMNVSLRTDVADSAKRLAAVHRESVEAKAYAGAMGPRAIMDLTNAIPGKMLEIAFRAASAFHLTEGGVVRNTILTNVPGPSDQLYFCGAQMVDSLYLGPLSLNVGLYHVVYSQVVNKKSVISLSITADRKMLPDPEYYAACLQHSFDALVAATLVDVAASSGAGVKAEAGPKAKPQARSEAKPKLTVKTQLKAAPDAAAPDIKAGTASEAKTGAKVN